MKPLSTKLERYERQVVGDEHRAHALAMSHLLAIKIGKLAREAHAEARRVLNDARDTGEVSVDALCDALSPALDIADLYCNYIAWEYAYPALQCIGVGMAPITHALDLWDGDPDLSDLNPDDLAAVEDLLHRAAQDFDSKPSEDENSTGEPT